MISLGGLVEDEELVTVFYVPAGLEVDAITDYHKVAVAFAPRVECIGKACDRVPRTVP